MDKKTEALKLAQNWYDSGNENPDDFADMIKKVIALAEQPAPVAKPHEQQEPVAWFDKKLNNAKWKDGLRNCDLADQQPLYTSPPPRKPLTDEEALNIARTFGAQPWPPGSCVAFARAIEAAHGIGEQK